MEWYHCVKSVRIRSCSGPYFPAFGLNTGRYSISLRIQSECGKIRTRITPNTDTSRSVWSGRTENDKWAIFRVENFKVTKCHVTHGYIITLWLIRFFEFENFDEGILWKIENWSVFIQKPSTISINKRSGDKTF